MCERIRNFYNSNKYAILWTVGYVIATWAIMRYMFNFNIFSATRWHQLMHAHLHGFAGFVFGILILAMIPLYVATTIVIARTKSPLFNFKFKVPKFIKAFFTKAFTQTPMDDEPDIETASEPETKTESESTPETETKSETDSTTTESKPEPVPATVPAEMRVAYERARDNTAYKQTSVFDLGHVTKKADAPTDETSNNTVTESEMPIPTDFDINDTENIIDDVPVFTDLDFDDDDNDVDETDSESQTATVQTATGNNDIVTKYLTEHSTPYTVENDVVITDKFAIVSHTDSDFWVADNESWFAAGKIRRSPIASVIESATAHNVTPVLYLGSDNIMDIDELRPQWERNGVRVISDLKNLG